MIKYLSEKFLIKNKKHILHFGSKINLNKSTELKSSQC